MDSAAIKLHFYWGLNEEMQDHTKTPAELLAYTADVNRLVLSEKQGFSWVLEDLRTGAQMLDILGLKVEL